MSEEKGKAAAGAGAAGAGLRQAMPVTAAWVDCLRTFLAPGRVDAALQATTAALREYRRLERDEGLAAADAWLARQTWPQGRFWCSEGGRQFGVPQC